LIHVIVTQCFIDFEKTSAFHFLTQLQCKRQAISTQIFYFYNVYCHKKICDNTFIQWHVMNGFKNKLWSKEFFCFYFSLFSHRK
jgi:hypothetical protein